MNKSFECRVNPKGKGIYQKQCKGLSELAPMTAPILFWMEGNSSIDFGLANHLQKFYFGWVKKNNPFFFFFFFSKHVLQSYQPHFRACNLSSSCPSYIFGGPNTLVSSVSKSNAHNSISSAIIHSNVSSTVPLPSFVLM